MKRPRVLVLTNIPSYHQVEYFDAIAARHELDLTVWYLRHSSPGRRWQKLPTPSHRHRFVSVLGKGSPLWFNPSIVQDFLRERIDLLVVCQFSGLSYQIGMLLAAARRVPFVFWSEPPAVRHFEVSSGVPEWARPVARHLAFAPVWAFAREIWAIGDPSWYLRHAPQVPLRELPYASNLKKFAVDRPVRSEGPTRLLFAGRFSYRKGFDLLIDALELLASESPELRWTFTALGYGDGETRLRSSPWFGSRLFLHPFVETQEVPHVFARHDVLIAPSRYDGWGMVVPEALASGMLVVASREMGSTKFLEARCRGLVPMSTPDELPRKLRQLLRESSMAVDFPNRVHAPIAYFDFKHAVLSTLRHG